MRSPVPKYCIDLSLWGRWMGQLPRSNSSKGVSLLSKRSLLLRRTREELENRDGVASGFSQPTSPLAL